MSDLIQYLSGRQTAIAAGCNLTKRLTARQMIQAASIAIHNTPALAKCTRESIFESVLSAARMGLDCSGLHGHGYLIAYGRKCMFIPGWRGLVSIARRASGVQDLKANVIHERDDWEYREGLDPDLVHKPCLLTDRGPVIAAYAVAYLDTGRVHFEVVGKAEIDAIAKDSRSDSWKNHFAAMARKTAVRRLCNNLPRSLDLDDALDIENAAEDSRETSAELRAIPAEEMFLGERENTADEVKKQIRKRKPRAPRKPRKSKAEPTRDEAMEYAGRSLRGAVDRFNADVNAEVPHTNAPAEVVAEFSEGVDVELSKAREAEKADAVIMGANPSAIPAADFTDEEIPF